MMARGAMGAAVDVGAGLVIGVVATVMTLAVSFLFTPLLAPLVPLAIYCGFMAMTKPVAAVLALVGLAYLDALGKKMFFFSPISPFKLFTVIAVVSLMLQVTRYRAGIQRASTSKVFRAYIVFMLAWVVALVLADSMRQGLSWALDLATISIILPMLLFTLQREDHARYAVWVIAAASGISALILAADIITGMRLVSTTEAATTARTAEGFDRSSGGSNENPTTAATMLLTGTIIALVHAIESPVFRRWFGLCALIGTIGVLLSFSRSAMITYVIISVPLAVRYRRHRLFPLACVFAVISFLAILPFMPASFWDRILSIFGGGGDWTLGRRLSYNIIGVNLLFENPIFGVGPGNFYSMFTNNEYRFLPGRTLTGRQLHNMYLSVAVEYGIVGFTCFMAMIVGGFQACLATIRTAASPLSRATATALLYGMIAYFIVSVFVPNEYNKYTWILPGVAGALWLATSRGNAKSGDDAHADKTA